MKKIVFPKLQVPQMDFSIPKLQPVHYIALGVVVLVVVGIIGVFLASTFAF